MPLTDEERKRMFDAFRVMPNGDEVAFEITRGPGAIEPEKTFSEDAIRQLNDAMMLWVGARIMAAWDRSGTPPTIAKVICVIEIH